MFLNYGIVEVNLFIMFLCISKETLSATAEIFEIITPITLMVWFFHSRWVAEKLAYYKTVSGLYGGFVNETINKSKDMLRYDGGLLMEIFTVDDNGYFRGQFEYFEEEVTLGGSVATKRSVYAGIQSFYGRLDFEWEFIGNTANPLLWKTNRIYRGELKIVGRLDWLTEDESSNLKGVYSILHHRESGVIEFTLKTLKNADTKLPPHFILFLKSNHALDAYTNVTITMKEPYYKREVGL
jgi:hypothetical protein